MSNKIQREVKISKEAINKEGNRFVRAFSHDSI